MAIAGDDKAVIQARSVLDESLVPDMCRAGGTALAFTVGDALELMRLWRLLLNVMMARHPV